MRKWCKEDPTHSQTSWLDIVKQLHDMEKITHTTRLQQSPCYEKREPTTKTEDTGQ